MMYYYLCYNSNRDFIGFSESEYQNFSKGFKPVTLEEYNAERVKVGMTPTGKTLDDLKKEKVEYSKQALEDYLNTHSLTWADGKQYSMTASKQSYLNTRIKAAEIAEENGEEYTLKWNATGEEAVVWTLENLKALALAIDKAISSLVEYQQTKEKEILAVISIEELNKILVDYTTLGIKTQKTATAEK